MQALTVSRQKRHDLLGSSLLLPASTFTSHWYRSDTVNSNIVNSNFHLKKKKKKIGGHTCPFLGPLVPLFWISGDVSSGVPSQSGFCLIRIVEANVMYIP